MDTGNKLVCPGDFANRFKGAYYKAIAGTIQAFYDLGCLPHDAKLTHVDDGVGLEQTTSVNTRTKFHIQLFKLTLQAYATRPNGSVGRVEGCYTYRRPCQILMKYNDFVGFFVLFKHVKTKDILCHSELKRNFSN